MLIFLTILNIKSAKKERTFYIIVTSCVSILNNLLIPNPYRSIISMIIIPVFVHIFFKTNLIKSILASLLPIAIIVVLESIFIKGYFYLFNIELTQVTTIPIYRLSIALIIDLCAYLIYKFIKSFHFIIEVFVSVNKSTKTILFINILTGFIAILIQFYLIGFYFKTLPIYITALSLFSFIAYFIISIFTFTRITMLELTKIDLEQEKEHNIILKLAQDDLRGFRHDFANIMCTIGGYVNVGDVDGLSKYYSQIQKDINKVNNLGALDPSVINNPAVFTLIASKYDKATELNITMNVNCFLDLNNLNMKIYEFTRVLGILLDNSIEAVQECEDKVINLEIRKDSSRNRQVLIIENTYSNKDIDTEKIYEKNFSTKEGNSGLGLWEVRQILKKNTNLNLFTSKNDKFFKQQLEMYNI